jgi:hypothetical protein
MIEKWREQEDSHEAVPLGSTGPRPTSRKGPASDRAERRRARRVPGAYHLPVRLGSMRGKERGGSQ